MVIRANSIDVLANIPKAVAILANAGLDYTHNRLERTINTCPKSGGKDSNYDLDRAFGEPFVLPSALGIRKF